VGPCLWRIWCKIQICVHFAAHPAPAREMMLLWPSSGSATLKNRISANCIFSKKRVYCIQNTHKIVFNLFPIFLLSLVVICSYSNVNPPYCVQNFLFNTKLLSGTRALQEVGRLSCPPLIVIVGRLVPESLDI
jgi:hypothetical protein